jgi:hypothetical protein
MARHGPLARRDPSSLRVIAALTLRFPRESGLPA